MKTKRYSIKDIAVALNVSITTVSFIINGKAKEKKISDEMTQRVLSYIKEINYKPNQLAQSLRTGKSKILVFMVEDISNHFYASIARIIEDIAYKKGYKVLFCSNENNDERSKELINLFNDRQVDGYIINPSPGIAEEITRFTDENVPVILFDRYFPEVATNYVGIDNESASYEATCHLINNGFKKIGFITIDTAQIQMVHRKSGYQKALQENDLTAYVLEIAYKPSNDDLKKEKIREFLKNTDLDAVYFATNYLTQSGLEVFREDCFSKLSEYGIITFDDHEFFKIHTPSISAISQPRYEIAESLMDRMMELLDNKEDKKVKTTVLKSKLIIRESTSHSP